ncbi:MAG: hypothetical protein QGG96_07445 [Candidatus Poseidoniaceae archaeon]|jgi:hypothetical protein|nr:hypothetical protein [Candidatus Poseidoniaceae archaeon]
MEMSHLVNHPWVDKIPARQPVEFEFVGEPGIHPEIEGITGRNIVFIIEKRFKRFEALLAKILRAPNVVRRTMHPMQSMLWELMDGKRNFFEICTIMDSLYHEDIAPVGDRVYAFIQVFRDLNCATLLQVKEEE